MAASSKGKGTTSTPTSSSCASKASSYLQEDQPLWGYVQKKGKAHGGGGNVIFECSFCRKEFTGTYTRVKAHLLHMKGNGIQLCKNIKPDSVNELKKEQEQYDMKRSGKQSGFLNIPSVLLHDDTVHEQKKRNLDTFQKSIEQTFALQKRQELDRKVGTFFFSSCIPFNAARNPYWKDLVTSLANSNMSGYVAPDSEKLQTIILQQEKSRIEKMLQYQKLSWEQHGVSIVSDGWTDIQRHPLINFIATSTNGPIFLKAIDAFGEYKNTEYLKGLFVELIEEVGMDKVVQIITDNAAVCRAAGLLVEQDYPHIFWTPCAVHSLNLALKSICNPTSKEHDLRAYELCSWIEELERDVKNIRNFIVNHQHALSIYNRYIDLKLLRVAETRFASIIVMMKRIKKVKSALINMVTDDDWNFYRAVDDDKAQTIKRLIVGDVFWDRISYFLTFTEPIWEMLRALDCDKPMLHCVYEMWNNMICKLRDVIFNHEKKNFALEDSDFFDHVHKILVTRWDKSNTPLQCMAYSLNPKYYGLKWLSEGIGRTPPHVDPEVSRHRVTCLKKIFRDSYQNERAHNEFASFSTRDENMDAMVDRHTYLPIPWWVKHGHAYPTLQYLALRLLVQPVTSSCSEKNWSTYSHIHNIKRNKLTSKRAKDLVYVHSNLRLLSRNSNEYRKEAVKIGM
ncbi:uncharacterized protein LOC116252633 [Nymphaea colorata]|nr:uncharacterized protein LOC116252633 [Nymphaea colorata]